MPKVSYIPVSKKDAVGTFAFMCAFAIGVVAFALVAMGV